MPDPEILAQRLERASNGLNRAIDAVHQWRRGAVAGVNFTTAQLAALRAEVNAGMQAGKDGITAVSLEMLN